MAETQTRSLNPIKRHNISRNRARVYRRPRQIDFDDQLVVSIKENQARSIKRNFMVSENSQDGSLANGLGPLVGDSCKLAFMMTSQSYTMEQSLDASSIDTLTKKGADTAH